MKLKNNNLGLTMAGLIVTVLIIAILSAAAFIWLDPLAKIGQAKDERRRHDVNIIATAISNYVNDHQGALPVLGAVTTSKQVLCQVQSAVNKSCGGDNVPCLRIAQQDFYDDYLPQLPLDPDKTANTDTGYYLEKDADNNLIVGACDTYGSTAITATPLIKITCDAYAGGYCWYVGDEEQSCDYVCSTLGMNCVSNITYGPDEDYMNQCWAALNKVFGGECGDECDVANENYPPQNIIDTGGECYYQTGTFNCSQATIVEYIPICPCE